MPKERRSSAKKGGSQRKKVKKEIARAVDTLPGLIIEHKRRDEIPAEPARPSIPDYQEPKGATFFLWSGVTIVMLFIGGLWFWNTRTLITDVMKNPLPETQIFEAAQEDFDAILSTLRDDEEKQNPSQPDQEKKQMEEEKIKETLSSLLTGAATTTVSTTTSTP